ncbi:S-layer homology domain-containing protein [Paenibacillus sp. WC2504]|uniref:S-layer homology domain-containing protein n=1 Tax=Paenibacillus sp. WC2504 TaxID=3461403 RepID=UPI0040454857
MSAFATWPQPKFTSCNPKAVAHIADARDYVEQIRQVGVGFLDGYEDGTFRPSKTLSREETAIMIYRLISYWDQE